MRCITLTTDFGVRDWFVGTMKGVILRVAGGLQVVDLTHEIAPGDIYAGAFALCASYSFFPRGTVHVAIVDPGVGTARRAIAVETADYFFVGPDNGVLSLALKKERIVAIHSLENPRFFLSEVSATFHGRDVFAPIAAHLSLGVSIRKFGPKLHEHTRLDWSEPELSRRELRGQVVYVDRFGNAITNIPGTALAALHREPAVFVRRKRVCAVASAYQAVAIGKAVAVVGSSGFLEIALNGGSAAKTLKLQPGTSVEVRHSISGRSVV